MWSERHRPLYMHGMVGNEEARSAVAEWFAGWRRGAKPLLMTGPPGIGKTTISGICARACGYDTVDLNASDARSKSRITEILRPVMDYAGLSGRTMVFVDEVDGIHGRSDYGGAEALIRLLDKPPVPVVLAANSQDTDKMRKLAKVTVHVPFRPVPPRLLRAYLQHILRKEGASLGPGSMVRVVSESRGDIRSMLNLAQSLVTGFRPDTEKSVQALDAVTGVERFFKAESRREASLVLYSMQMDPREKINAFYSSVVTSGTDPGRMARMLDVISRADVLHGRIMSTQNWRLLRYLNSILEDIYDGGTPIPYTKYNLPFPLLSRIRFDGGKLRALGRSMGCRLHMSGSAFAAVTLPFYLELVRRGAAEVPEEFADIISKEASR